jgi:ankyrin repeat protein
VDFNCVDYRARSALHIACIHGFMPTVRFLLREQVNLDKIDSTGTSPLYHAIKRRHEDIAKLLYWKGASVTVPAEKLGKLLCTDGFTGDLLRVKLLNECDANIETADYDMRTVAHLAAAESHWDLLSYLVKKTKFNFELMDRFGKTPFDEISDSQKRREFEALLKEVRSNPNFIKSLKPKSKKDE